MAMEENLMRIVFVSIICAVCFYNIFAMGCFSPCQSVGFRLRDKENLKLKWKEKFFLI
jgi:hypothetical protein